MCRCISVRVWTVQVRECECEGVQVCECDTEGAMANSHSFSCIMLG